MRALSSSAGSVFSPIMDASKPSVTADLLASSLYPASLEPRRRTRVRGDRGALPLLLLLLLRALGLAPAWRR
jgi:hypothetical protein